MQTERFYTLRKTSLEKIFNKSAIVETWRKVVKAQLRSMDLKDLYDHYDFNYNIEERAFAIRSEILNGNYKAEQPLFYRVEKKLGVCRHLVIPQPTDALVLQVLVETISPNILNNQPSENAFYSRDKHTMTYPHSVQDYGLTWRQQWKKLQKIIYKFNEEKNLIIVTDLANYYDNIDINELNKVFSSLSQIEEVIVDLLFRIIEDISWTPDYLSYSGKGLPVVNIEGVRFLAHSFLFEIDSVIKKKTNNSFARWMDDITIGVDNRTEAIELISLISDMLKSRGLALNLSKTDIYDDIQGHYHFQIDANRYIDSVEKTKATDGNYKDICKQLLKKFKAHIKKPGPKYWDKVSKRYITTFTRLKLRSLLPDVSEIYLSNPNIRGSILMYLNTLGYDTQTSNVILEIIDKIDVFDDLSLYQICSLVTDWEIPVNSESKEFLSRIEQRLKELSFNRPGQHSNFYCILWFKTKYSHPEDLLKHIEETKNYWQTNSFLRRQVTAALSRLLVFNSKIVEVTLSSQISSGVSSTVTVANQILSFSVLEKLNLKLTSYLFPEKQPKIYSLPRFMVLCSVLNSRIIRNDITLKSKIKNYIKDPFYLKWLDSQYNIN